MSFYCLSDGKTIFLFYFILWLFYKEQYGTIWALKCLTKTYSGGGYYETTDNITRRGLIVVRSV